MRSNFIRQLLLIILTGCSSLLLAEDAVAVHDEVVHDRIVQIGAVEGYPLNPLGIAILTDAYSQLNLKIQVTELPSQRSLQMTRTSQLDGELGRIEAISLDYPELIKVDVPLLTFTFVAITNKKALALVPVEELHNYRIGVTWGAKMNDYIDIPGVNMTKTFNTEQLRQMLTSGRIDFAIIPSAFVPIWQQGADDLTLYSSNYSVGSFDIFHYLNPGHSQLAQQLTRVLSAMKKNGVLRKYHKQAQIADPRP